jgi:hypothetical protein
MKNKLFASKELIEYAFVNSIHVAESSNNIEITKECVNILGADACMSIYLKKCNTIGIEYEYLYKLQEQVIEHMVNIGLSTPTQDIVSHFKTRYTPEERCGMVRKWPQLFLSWKSEGINIIKSIDQFTTPEEDLFFSAFSCQNK